MEYFNNVSTVIEIKKLYKSLAMAHHPDRPNGSTEIMKAINIQYQGALQHANGEKSSDNEGHQFTYRYNPDIESAVMDMIDVLLSLKMDSVNLSLIGLWVWLDGVTKPYKEDLKALGCKWHNKRKCWFWHHDSYRSSYSSKDSLPDLAAKYGVRTFTKPTHEQPLTIH